MRYKLTIKAGTALRKKSGGWHTFEQDHDPDVELDPRTYDTLYVVKSGPDRGKYHPRGL